MTRARGRRFSIRENARHGSKREPVGSTITTPEKTAPLESRRQRRALRGPKYFRTAVVSTVRDADAGAVQTYARKRKPRKGAPYNPTHRDEPGRFTMNVGGSCAPRYVPGNG